MFNLNGVKQNLITSERFKTQDERREESCKSNRCRARLPDTRTRKRVFEAICGAGPRCRTSERIRWKGAIKQDVERRIFEQMIKCEGASESVKN
jgi:hypothetical protein